jgi:hypothetical protein
MAAATGKYAPPGFTKMAWVTTVTLAAPTAAQLNAGTRLETFARNMTNIPRAANLVDVATLDTKYEKRQVGTRGGEVITQEFLRDGTTDTAYTTIVEDGVGYWVIARKGIAGATFAAGDKVDVYPVTVASKVDGTPGRNDPDFFTAEMVVTEEPNRNVTVV